LDTLIGEIITIPLTAWLSQVFSVRWYLLVNVGLFLVFSCLCGTARTLIEMNLYRAAHARLLAAIEKGNPFQIQEHQDFWLKCSETLRKLDLAVEMARRDAEEQVPKKLAELISLYISEWLRIAFAQFLTSEARSLMGIKEVGEFKAYAIERFKGILDLTVKSSLQTRSPIPAWAAKKVKEPWNIN